MYALESGRSVGGNRIGARLRGAVRRVLHHRFDAAAQSRTDAGARARLAAARRGFARAPQAEDSDRSGDAGADRTRAVWNGARRSRAALSHRGARFKREVTPV